MPFGPGGSGDITARLIGKQIEERTKQAVVIDNRPGANGIIGTMAVKTAEPDGYTVLLITTSTHAANSASFATWPTIRRRILPSSACSAPAAAT